MRAKEADPRERAAARSVQTRRTLLWAALVLLLVGGAVGAPEAGVASAALAALCALPAIVTGPKRIRVVAVAVLLAAAALTAALLPGARIGLDSYRDRAQRRPPAPGPESTGPR